MAQTRLDILVSLLGGAAAVSGLSMIRQNANQLKASLDAVKIRQQLGTDLLSLKGRFNEITRSGQYSKTQIAAITRELADMTAKARAAGLNIGKLHTQLRQLRVAEIGLNLRQSGRADMARGAAMRQQAYGRIMETVAVAARFEDVVKDIAITGELTKQEELGLAKSIRGLSVRYNQSQEDVAEAMKKLVETGMSQRTASVIMPLMAKTATATRTDSSDAAKMARSFELLGVKDMELAFNQAARAGKQGSFELRDMARWFPALGGFMKELGVTGNEAVVSMASRMQVATRTAGSNDEAANNFKNFLTRLTSQDTIKDFKKQGVDLIAQLQAAARQGIDPIAAGVDLVMQHVKTKAPQAAAELKKVAEEVAKITDPAQRQAELERRSLMIQKLGDRAGIGDLFQDMQAVSYLLAELQNKDSLNTLMDDVKTGKNEHGQATLDADYERRTEGMAEKIKGLKIALTDFGIALGNAMMPAVDFLIPIIRSLTRLVTWITGTFPLFSRLAAGVFLGASAMSVLGFAGRYMAGGFLSTLGVLKDVGGWLLATRAGVTASATAMRVYQTVLAGLRMRLAGVALSSQLAGGPMALLGQVGRSAFTALIVGVRTFSLALMTTPVGWITAAIAAIAFLVWKYWKPIKAFVTGMWNGLKSGLAPVFDALRPALAALRTAFGNLMTALAPLSPVLKVLFMPLLLPLKLVVAGLQMLWGWVKQLFTPVQDTGNAARNMGEAFGQSIARALTWMAKLVAGFLALPTRMIQIGADIVNGLVGSIKRGWNGLTRAVSELGNGIAAVFSGGLAGVSRLIVNWSPLGLFYKAFAGVMSWFGVALPRNFTDFGAGIIGGLSRGIQSVIGGVFTVTGNLWSGIKTAFSGGIAGVGTVTGSLWNGIKTAFSGGISGMGRLIVNWSPLGLFYKAFAGVMSWFGVTLPKSFTSFGAKIISRLAGGIRSAIGSALTVIGNLWSGIKTAFSGGLAGVGRLIMNWSPVGLFHKAFAGAMSWFGVTLPRNFTDFGANIINGLINGIKSVIGSALTTIGNLASGLKSRFTSLLGIKSPSTVFMGFGGNIGQGLEIGMTRMLPGIRGAANMLAGVAMAGAAAAGSGVMFANVRAASQTLSRAPSSAPVPFAQPSATSAGGGMTIHFAPTITVTGAVGSSDAKGQVQQAMRLSLRELEQMMRRIQAEQQRRAF